MVRARDERRRQVGVAAAILGCVAVGFIALAVGAHLPGLAGEFFARILGFATTPFILESSLFILGFVVVLTLNQWRQMRDGDEFVSLEQFAESPDQGAFSYSRSPGAAAASPTELLEAAMTIGNHAEATEILASMSEAEREQPGVLRLRLALAEATGQAETVAELREKLA